MKFDLPKHEKSGQARELILTVGSIQINAQENLLDNKGEVSFKGESKSLNIGMASPMPNPEKESPATEVFKTRVLEAFADYYKSTNL